MKEVPWNGKDVCILYAAWLFLSISGVVLALALLGKPGEKHTATTEHLVFQLIQQGWKEPSVLFIALVSSVIVAPFAEEFLFRSIFQGYLTKKWSAALSVFTVSAVFGLMHAGSRTSQTAENLSAVLTGMSVGNLLFLCFALLYLFFIVKATPQDIGFGCRWTKKQFAADTFLALEVFCCCCPFILTLTAVLRLMFPNTVIDPIPLFLFSLVLGMLYQKTHRLLPCILLHTFLNGFSFTVALIFCR
ncbi:MAG: CPBP family intramembrane metalloprotease [Planctomycetaceae bacterium]|jgi:membrane protease YdiL (CAAX protease family)|nr:CPBP family intramembrane metalloprotease [Planctomycetaceae bacterium]